MSAPRWLFWHRRDLRLADNLGLAAAAAATPAVTGVFVLDPAILADPAMAPARLWFLRESLRELAQGWREAGSRLVLLEGDPAVLLPRLAAAVGAEVVAWNRDVEPYGRERDRRVAAALQAEGLRLLVDWDQLLVAPEKLRTGAGEPYRVYGPFLRNWRGQVAGKEALGLPATAGGLTPVAAPHGLLDLDPAALQRPELWQALPQLDSVAAATGLERPFAGADLCPCRPGERAAHGQLRLFTEGEGRAAALLAYEPGRNHPGAAGTSGLSAALKFGTLSPRQAWAAAQAARSNARSEEERESIAVWEQELAWREFYQQALFHFPELAEGPYRPQWRHFPWRERPRPPGGLAAGPHRGADRGRGDAPAERERLDAQPLPHDRGLLPGEGPDLRLAAGGAHLPGAAGGRRPGGQQRRLAVEQPAAWTPSPCGSSIPPARRPSSTRRAPTSAPGCRNCGMWPPPT